MKRNLFGHQTINSSKIPHKTHIKINLIQNNVFLTVCNILHDIYREKKVKYNWCNFWSLFTVLSAFVLLNLQVQAAPRSSADNLQKIELNLNNDWPQLVKYDIWSFSNVSEINDKVPLAESLVTGPLLGNDIGYFENTNNLHKQFQKNLYSLICQYYLENSGSRKINTAHKDLSDPIPFGDLSSSIERKSKVIHLFPVPVDGECLADDGRRTGSCLNPYECRAKSGSAKGECAMGFGVCCIFTVTCNETINNNITYIVSPNFPSFMPSNFTFCKFNLKLISSDISQLRIDFYHFSLGQPNRRTGVCDGDAFNISGGPAGSFLLCGQNSGQHIYYDISGRAFPRQESQQLQSHPLYGTLNPLTYEKLYGNLTQHNPPDIEITMRFSKRILPIRLWEIRIIQIPFSQRAPAGCLQYHTGIEGIIQTFNFAENGRHLANQHYRICMRQEIEMCSIVYEPCDEQSFRIGPTRPMTSLMSLTNSNQGVPVNDTGSIATSDNVIGGSDAISTNASMSNSGIVPINSVQNDDFSTSESTDELINELPSSTITTSDIQSTTNTIIRQSTTTTTTTTTMSTTTENTLSSTESSTTTTSEVTTTTSRPSAPTRATTPINTSTTSSAVTTSTTTEPSLADDVDGSGDDTDTAGPSILGATRRPRPVSGGFDLLGFLRSAFDFTSRRADLNGRFSIRNARDARQFYSTCTDRITMPCIIEDFIGTGFSPLPGCEPVHCGSQFCSNAMWPCRIESTVTPFYIGVNFGNGQGKGSAEDNIGVCLRYEQIQCL